MRWQAPLSDSRTSRWKTSPFPELFRSGTGRIGQETRLVAILRLNRDPSPSSISAEQCAYFKSALEENAGVAWTCVFMHKPLWDESAANVQVRVAAPVAASSLYPLPLTWRAEVLTETGPSVSVDGRISVCIAMPAACTARTQPVIVDGDLSEWPSLPVQCYEPAAISRTHRLWSGPEDASFRFAVHHDKTNLHIAIQVQDDVMTLSPGRESWKQDGLRVYIDGRNPPPANPGKEFEDYLLVALSPGDGQALFSPEKLPEGLQAACGDISGGYTMELSIPSAYLDEVAGEPWKSVRINIGLTDVDGGPLDPRTYLWWRPEWGQPNDNPEYGVFRRDR